jgi:aminoglycoside 6'-N-acetyltransferase I
VAVHTTSFEEMSAEQRNEAAAILLLALSHAESVWRDMPAARAEVATFIGNSDRLAIAAVEDGRLVGWIGAIRHSQHAWELHPLVVHPAYQRRGHGTALVAALENAARREKAITIWLGSDDDFGGTNLFGVGLYPDVLTHLQHIAPVGGHPFVFYRRLGYTVVGALPDVGGAGKHDILMAKRL